MANANQSRHYPFPNGMTEAERLRLAKVVIRLLDEWNLKSTEKLRLLGLRETSRNMLIKYREQALPISADLDQLTRVGLLLEIYKNLYDLYPENPSLRQTWVLRHNQLLGDKRPLDLMLERGLFGMADILRFLDLQKAV